MTEFNADAPRASFAKYLMFLAIMSLGSCGLEPSVPSGGIVDNGNRPPDRHKNEGNSGDAKAQPSTTPAQDQSQSDNSATMVAYESLFGGHFRFQLPAGHWNKDAAIDLGHETWRSEASHFVTFTRSDAICPSSGTITRTTNTAGTLVTRCSTTLATAKTSSGDLLKIDHNLSDSEFEIIAKSLGNDPSHR